MPEENKMTYQCKYHKVCPQYDRDGIRCNYFYSFCKESKRRTKLSNLEVDKVFNAVVRFMEAKRDARAK